MVMFPLVANTILSSRALIFASGGVGCTLELVVLAGIEHRDECKRNLQVNSRWDSWWSTVASGRGRGSANRHLLGSGSRTITTSTGTTAATAALTTTAIVECATTAALATTAIAGSTTAAASITATTLAKATTAATTVTAAALATTSATASAAATLTAAASPLRGFRHDLDVV